MIKKLCVGVNQGLPETQEDATILYSHIKGLLTQHILAIDNPCGLLITSFEFLWLCRVYVTRTHPQTHSFPVDCTLASSEGNAEAFWISGGTWWGLRPPTLTLAPCRLLGGTYTPLGFSAAGGSDGDSVMGMETWEYVILLGERMEPVLSLEWHGNVIILPQELKFDLFSIGNTPVNYASNSQRMWTCTQDKPHKL